MWRAVLCALAFAALAGCGRQEWEAFAYPNKHNLLVHTNLRVLDRQLAIESTDGSAPEVASLADVGQRVRIHGRVVAAWSLKKL